MSFATLKRALQGISAINITPFAHDTLKVREDLLRENIQFLKDHNMNVIVPNGNTGEFYSLTLEESHKVNSIVIDEVQGQCQVVAGVGYDEQTAINMAQSAEALGADGVMIHQPPHPYISGEGLVDYYGSIAQSVNIGVVLYLRQPLLSGQEINQLKKYENIVGVKHAYTDLQKFGELVKTFNDWDAVWVCGSAEAWAPFYYAAGAKGFTSGLVNVEPELSRNLLKALNDNDRDHVLDLWYKIKPFEDMRNGRNSSYNVSVVKEAMKLKGMNPGTVRPPINELTKDNKSEVNKILENWASTVSTRS
ncbi:dihydrodipicolinate synthase family protein [Natribacillus halophilus]|uniref:4-hydroxy-tetrahydrodipicolinate synthase n=1 Tax=Natribacillus halophilus TaxID=549003 RepID=A0A1G8RCN7_9BACI|nr:dihydrodipicolinate synthase family protein [Natribacillus halophilus]SDJ14623.1 4-hydroxy-tetrahydrodipicolinate synthase [Natribacillus halophilus]